MRMLPLAAGATHRPPPEIRYANFDLPPKGEVDSLFSGELVLALVRAELSARIGIAVYAAFEVPQKQVVAVAADDEVRRKLNLAAAARGVDRKDRRRVAGGEPAQPLNDLTPLLHIGAEVGGTADRVALVEVVRTDSALQQSLHQGLHHGDVVVDALHQHGLAAQWDAGVGEAGGRFGDFFRQLVGVSRVDAHPEGMVLLEDRDQVLGDALGHDERNLSADAQELDVLDGADAAQKVVELVVAQGQRVAAGE